MSSPVPITPPELGTPRAVVGVWYARPGERVYEGDRVAELVIPGAVFDVTAPATGTLRERLAVTNEPITADRVLGTIDPDPEG